MQRLLIILLLWHPYRNHRFFQTKKVVKRARKKPTNQKKRCPIEVTAEQADDLWQDTVSVNLSACIQGREGGISQDVIVPFDPVSDVSVDEQA